MILQDDDRRVRELTQVAFHSLVVRCQKNLAPHLVAILPRWLAAQHDTYAPTATAAKAAWNAAFTPEKQEKALLHAKQEILQVIYIHFQNMLWI